MIAGVAALAVASTWFAAAASLAVAQPSRPAASGRVRLEIASCPGVPTEGVRRVLSVEIGDLLLAPFEGDARDADGLTIRCAGNLAFVEQPAAASRPSNGCSARRLSGRRRAACAGSAGRRVAGGAQRRRTPAHHPAADRSGSHFPGRDHAPCATRPRAGVERARHAHRRGGSLADLRDGRRRVSFRRPHRGELDSDEVRPRQRGPRERCRTQRRGGRRPDHRLADFAGGQLWESSPGTRQAGAGRWAGGASRPASRVGEQRDPTQIAARRSSDRGAGQPCGPASPECCGTWASPFPVRPAGRSPRSTSWRPTQPPSPSGAHGSRFLWGWTYDAELSHFGVSQFLKAVHLERTWTTGKPGLASATVTITSQGSPAWVEGTTPKVAPRPYTR